MKHNQKTVIGVIVCLMVIGVLSAFGQTNAVDVRPADTAIRDFLSSFSYWKLLIVPITGVVCFAVKHFAAKIPNKLIPIIGPIVGGVLDLVASKFGFWTSDPAAGAMMGALATWAHQLFAQMSESVENPPKADA